MPAIEIKNVTKSFGETPAVDDISLSIEHGELFGLIGPDGAGKTTLMRSICTLLIPDAGEIRVLDIDVTREVARLRRTIGYMPQRFSLYQDLSVEQNLRFFADIFQVPASERDDRMQELYRFSRLGKFKSRQAGALSGGMKQKLALSCALVHTPEVLILDEPTFGVDPVSRQEFWEILREIQKGGTTILVSTAYMDEADQCDRVALMHRGRIVALDAPQTLKSSFHHVVYEVAGDDLRELSALFAGQAVNIQLFGDKLHVSFHSEPGEQQWQAWQRTAAGDLQAYRRITPSIEDIFLSGMGSANAES